MDLVRRESLCPSNYPLDSLRGAAMDGRTFLGAGGGIRTHEGLRHRVLSPRRARHHRAHCPFDLAMVPPRYGAPGGSFRGRATFEPAINGSRAC